MRLGLLLLGGSLLAVDLVLWREALSRGFALDELGIDFAIYRDAAARWLATGEWFWPYQLAGPYALLSQPLPVLYPPLVIPFFAAFSVLPAALYWVVPIVGTAWIVWSWRPTWQAWLAIAGCLLWPSTFLVLWNGNPTLWIVFIVALATRWPAAGPWVMLKPTMAPLALVGIRRRSWWLGLAALAAYGLLWLPMLPETLAALLNVQANGALYSWTNWPAALIPVVAALHVPRQLEEDLGDGNEAVVRLSVPLRLGQVDVGVAAQLAHGPERLHLGADRAVVGGTEAAPRANGGHAIVEHRDLGGGEVRRERE